MLAVISVTGKDCVGIIADVSVKCREHKANIIDISQTVLQGYFAMIMLVELDHLSCNFAEFAQAMKARGEENGVDIHVMHEDIFNTMHHI